MFEDDLFDEEIKKKKRRVLIVLLILLLLGVLAALPLVEVSVPSPTVVVQDTATATHESPTSAPSVPAVEATPQPTATAVVAGTTLAGTEEMPAGTGGGTLIAAETPSGTGGDETPGPLPTGGIRGTPEIIASATVVTEHKGTPGADETPVGVGGGTPVAILTTTATPEAGGTPGTGETPAGVGSGTPGVTGTTTAVAGGGGEPGVEGTPAGIGGGTPGPTITATGVLPASTTPATSTMMPPGELPVTGDTRGFVPGWLAIGLVVVLLGAGVAAARNAAPQHRIRR